MKSATRMVDERSRQGRGLVDGVDEARAAL
nr:MAG TPA: hypothetical protein [Caudoviricetes sp.]